MWKKKKRKKKVRPSSHNGKPLFKITCGDLGLTPGQVESNLRGIFPLASLWDCILLLDEVDTFSSQRSKADAAMHKNALVSGSYFYLKGGGGKERREERV